MALAAQLAPVMTSIAGKPATRRKKQTAGLITRLL